MPPDKTKTPKRDVRLAASRHTPEMNLTLPLTKGLAMTLSPRRRRAVKSLPLFDWANRNAGSIAHISPMARLVRHRWGYSPQAAKAVCEAWGIDGGHTDV